ncbi:MULTISPECIES: DUF3987 domain-containing protein [unclassified Bradyrhizobium]|uniref:DUF3987 domain-containing protein n=1 Tax=unclassified Bradyrhizobium TaxID=2631580 RepID=UPI0033988280
MAALNTKTADTSAEPSFREKFEAKDVTRIADLYFLFADTLGAVIRLAPLAKRGGVDWSKKRLVAGEYTKPAADDVPETFAEIERWFVLVDYVDGCSDESTFAVFLAPHLGRGEAPVVWQLSGPIGDEQVGRSVIFRDLNLGDILEWQVSVYGMPDAANDNAPPDERDLPAPPEKMTNPMAPESAGGLLADVARWITSTAIVPVPELSMVSAVALIGGMFGDRALGPTLSGLNMFATTLLETAGGKGHPPKAIRAIAGKAGKPGAVTNGDPTSYAAIERVLRKNPSTVVVFDEFGVTLQDVNGRNASAPAASLRKFLLAIYDQANSVFDGRIYASAETKKDDAPIKGPALTVLGMTTAETLYAGLSERSISDGFINRFVFVTGTPPKEITPPKLHRHNAPPESLVEALQAAVKNFPRPASMLGVGKIVIEFEDGEAGAAYKRWGEVFSWQHHEAWNETERNINGRAAENTVRLATIRAISRNPTKPVILVDDVEWGWAIVHASIELVTSGAAKHMHASPAEALRKAIVAALREAKDYTLPLSKLMVRKGISGAEMRELQQAVLWLTQSGEVMDMSGRPTVGRGSKLKWNGT